MLSGSYHGECGDILFQGCDVLAHWQQVSYEDCSKCQTVLMAYAWLTEGSGCSAMFGEAVHSVADTMNQVSNWRSACLFVAAGLPIHVSALQVFRHQVMPLISYACSETFPCPVALAAMPASPLCLLPHLSFAP